MRTSVVAVVACLSLGAACAPRATPPPATPRHLVLVTVDTLRADRLGCYGSRSVPTPNFDRLAGEGVRALDATTHVPMTRPSHASILTARYPSEHGVRDNIAAPLADDVPTLAGVLASNGFTTAAFVSSIVLAKQSGLNRGFAHYDDGFEPAEGQEGEFLSSLQRRGDDTVASVARWLDTRPADDRAKRLALWVHLYDPHDPYEPPEPFASRFADRPYDGEVAWTDEVLGRLRRTLEEHGLFDDALVVVLADHGEALGEHGETGHGFFTYETTLKIPLLVKGPGIRAGAVIEGTVRTVDVMPTVLDVLGMPGDRKAFTGESIAASLRAAGPAPDASTYAESLTPLTNYGWSDLRVLRDGRWKYILAPRPELYDISSDPGELTNVVEAQPARARALRGALEEMLREEQGRQASTAGAPAMSPEMLERLGALGYVSPGGSAVRGAQGADPKDKIGEFLQLSGLMREALTALGEGAFAASAAKFTSLKQAGMDGFQVHFYLGRALVGLRRHREAEQSFERAIAAFPAFAPAHLELANVRIAAHDLDGALAALRQGLETSPNDPALIERTGQVLQKQGDMAGALAAYERVMAAAPRDSVSRWRAGELLLGQAEIARAVALFREATVLSPEVAEYWNSLGMALAGSDQLPDAEAAFRAATERDGRNAQYAYNLGLAKWKQRKPDAADAFERALQLDPRFAPARERLREMNRAAR
ncbi:MAG: sulfatase-like hydrolase/transferase [Vicinamibacterales bacterium]